MKWQLLVCVAFLYQYGLVQIAIKKIGAVEGSRTRKLVYQYFFAAMFAVITAVLDGQVEVSVSVMYVAIIGAANAFGCYCHWRAYDISMSRTAMLSNLDDFMAISLGYGLLGELDVLTPSLAAGVVLSLVAAIVFARTKHGENGSGRQIIGWVLGYSIIWGVAMFSMRLFSVQGMSLVTFVAAWYGGSWLGALFTRFVIMGREESGLHLTITQKAKTLLLAAAIWTSLMFAYWIRKFVPITVVQPIQLIAEMSIPVVIAFIFFGEARDMTRKEKYIIAVGLVGVVLVAISY